jgi:hypothetical protein
LYIIRDMMSWADNIASGGSGVLAIFGENKYGGNDGTPRTSGAARGTIGNGMKTSPRKSSRRATENESAAIRRIGETELKERNIDESQGSKFIEFATKVGEIILEGIKKVGAGLAAVAKATRVALGYAVMAGLMALDALGHRVRGENHDNTWDDILWRGFIEMERDILAQGGLRDRGASVHA